MSREEAIEKRACEIAYSVVDATRLKDKQHTEKYACAWQAARLTALRFLRGEVAV